MVWEHGFYCCYLEVSNLLKYPRRNGFRSSTVEPTVLTVFRLWYTATAAAEIFSFERRLYVINRLDPTAVVRSWSMDIKAING